MWNSEGNKLFDHRDEIVLGLMVVLIPLASLPGLIGL